MSRGLFVSILHCIQLSSSNFSLLFFVTSRSLADGVQSDISLIHPKDINWFITTDETHHPFTTEGNKGGSTAQCCSTNLFHCSGERCLQSATHTTGVYGTTSAGYSLPPLYVFSSDAKVPEDFEIKGAVCEGVFRLFERSADKVLFANYPSHVAVHHMGSVDTSLWHKLNRVVYIPCFKGKISVEPVRDPVTLKLISGPVITKTDAGL